VMNEGAVQQLGDPQDVYDRPANLFVEGFIGSPPMNLLRGVVIHGRIEAGDLAVERPSLSDGEVVVGVRPEAFRIASDGSASTELIVEVVEPLGDEVLVHGSIGGEPARSGAELDEVLLPVERGSRAPITARLDPSARPRPGDRLPLLVAPERVYVFDARTGAALR
jgi:ABC-type sugar transport system ATPase subunit